MQKYCTDSIYNILALGAVHILERTHSTHVFIQKKSTIKCIYNICHIHLFSTLVLALSLCG